jgi:adenosylmethionine-8-amino-7-oxononanoate aminotransferase
LLFDDSGNPYIDAISSWWVNLHGHAHPYIAQAIGRQASQVSQAIFGNFTHEPAVRLAERLLDLLPTNQRCVFYSDNGSTAVEVALKLALHYHQVQGEKQRRRFVYLEGAYHGDTFGAMAVSDRGVFTAPFFSHLTQATALPFPRVGM